MTTFLIQITVVTAALFSAAGLASAQTGAIRGTPEEQRACNLDVRQHCREVMSQGDMAVLACLQQNRGKLERSCKAVLSKHGQ
jgi:hypothetical protein